jgi:hypothetical protein
MGFFGNLIGKGLGGLAGGLFGDKGRSVGSDIGGTLGSALIPFSKGGRLMTTPSLQKGGKLRPLGRMPSMRMGGKIRKGSAAAKRKMAMLRSLKK